MIIDIYAHYGCSSIDEVKRLREDTDLNPYTKITLLSLAMAFDELKELARADYRGIVHQKNKPNPYTQEVISHNLNTLNSLILSKANNVSIHGSFLLRFNFILSKPFISRDDDEFYVIDNPVRKDKVFKVPMISSTAWKGNLRWTMMKTFLEDKVSKLTADEFAGERLRESLIFGTEKGMEESRGKAWTKYLDDMKSDASSIYRAKIKKHFGLKNEDVEPHFKGRLIFHPTFFNKIDLMVINPHKRESKTGKNPIYIECVPAGAKGNFALFYFPYDLIGRENISPYQTTLKDLNAISIVLKEMFLTYGFSAKKASGFGVARDEDLNGTILINLAEPIKKNFLKFGELEKFAKELNKEYEWRRQ